MNADNARRIVTLNTRIARWKSMAKAGALSDSEAAALIEVDQAEIVRIRSQSELVVPPSKGAE